MKKFALFMFVAAVLSLCAVGCKTTVGTTIAEKTGIGDGKVSIVEAIAIKIGVTSALKVVPVTAQAGIHIVTAGLLEKLDNDAITLETLETKLPEVITEAGITDAEVLSAIDELSATMKQAIIAQLGETEDTVYLVGIKAVLEELYAQTGV